jgi:hypothetical protein
MGLLNNQQRGVFILINTIRIKILSEVKLLRHLKRSSASKRMTQKQQMI